MLQADTKLRKRAKVVPGTCGTFGFKSGRFHDQGRRGIIARTPAGCFFRPPRPFTLLAYFGLSYVVTA